jgi:hypothetical protein
MVFGGCIIVGVRRQLERAHDIKLTLSSAPALNRDLVSEDMRAMFSDGELRRLFNEGRPCQRNWILASAKAVRA